MRAAADGERLVVIGIEPTRPDTAYGYLRMAEGRSAARPVERFVEKPRPAAARRYLASGRYLWNAGMLLARPERVLDEAREHAPEIWDAAGDALERLAAGRRVPRAQFEKPCRGQRRAAHDRRHQ
jgi:mannose-1-phosphate guanylyltransferase